MQTYKNLRSIHVAVNTAVRQHAVTCGSRASLKSEGKQCVVIRSNMVRMARCWDSAQERICNGHAASACNAIACSHMQKIHYNCKSRSYKEQSRQRQAIESKLDVLPVQVHLLAFVECSSRDVTSNGHLPLCGNVCKDEIRP